MNPKLSIDQNEFTNAAGAVFRAVESGVCGPICGLFANGAGCLLAPCHAVQRNDGRGIIWIEDTEDRPGLGYIAQGVGGVRSEHVLGTALDKLEAKRQNAISEEVKA